MRYSNYSGVLGSLLLIAACLLPWVYIPGPNLTISGFHTEHTNFGSPGLFHIIFCAIAIILFLMNGLGAKRINVFVCTLNFAWGFRNFLLVTQCELGDCPEKKLGIFLIIILSLLMLIMSLLPKGDIVTVSNLP